MQPARMILRTYQVGFGDCFLLSFDYGEAGEKHVLMDFGSTSLPAGAPKDRMLQVARDIAARCAGKLTAVVATHRHKDHISGFATSEDEDGSGDIIRALDPDIVLQPWTEDPELEPDAIGPDTPPEGLRVHSLKSMNAVAKAVKEDGKWMRKEFAIPRGVREELEFLGDDNISNRSAVRNLMKMGRDRRYLHTGMPSGLEALLPGVETFVLGPPTVAQTATVLKQRSRDENEFWHLRRLAAEGAQALGRGAGSALFDKTYIERDKPPFPEHTRWLIYKAQQMNGRQLLGIVRTLDKAMNNTSLILLMKVGKRSLLFPGDAQIENWRYALDQPEYQRLLAEVDLYKVGHHGSLNATPKTLWKMFDKKSKRAGSDRLRSVMSTMVGKHGKAESRTEVPRTSLLEDLRAETDLFTTHEDMSPGELYRDMIFPFA